MKKNLISAMIGLSVAMCCNGVALAEDIEPNEVWSLDGELTEAESEVTLEVLSVGNQIVATVPLEIPLISDTDGNVTAPTDAQIINHSDKDLVVTGITVNMSGSEIMMTDASLDIAESEDKALQLNMRGDCITDNINTVDESNWQIPADGELDLDVEAELSKGLYEQPSEKTSICTIKFTIAIDE